MFIIRCLKSMCKKKIKYQSSQSFNERCIESNGNNTQKNYSLPKDDLFNPNYSEPQENLILSIIPEFEANQIEHSNFDFQRLHQVSCNESNHSDENPIDLEMCVFKVPIKNDAYSKEFDSISSFKYNSMKYPKGSVKLKKNNCSSNVKKSMKQSQTIYFDSLDDNFSDLSDNKVSSSLKIIIKSKKQNQLLLNDQLQLNLSFDLEKYSHLKEEVIDPKNNERECIKNKEVIDPKNDKQESIKDQEEMNFINKDNQENNCEIPIKETLINIFDQSQDDNILIKTQEDIMKLRENELLMINSTVDKTKTCIFCQFLINEEDISFSLLCKHKSCFICIYNKLQDIIEENDTQFLMCACDTVIHINLLAKNIELESLNLYVEIISRISKISISIKSYCPYCLHFNEKIISNQINICENCKNHFCLKCGLAHFTQTCLEYYNETFKEKIKEKIAKCTECNTNPFEIELGCECQLCLKCCKTIIKDFLYNDNPIQDPICFKHNIIIPRMYIYQAFGGKNFFIKEQEKAIDFTILSPMFNCEICFFRLSVNQSITLGCDHRFCGNCIKLHLNCLMREYSFANKIECPICNKPIDYEILKNNSDPDAFESYLKFSVMIFQPEDKVEVMKWCKNCDFGCIVSVDQETFICPNCQPGYYEDYEKSESKDVISTKSSLDLKEKKEFLEIFYQNYVKCPNCSEAIEKVAGCNFLTCYWPRCTEISFCALCSKKLTKDQHYSHYKVSGPFGKTCNTLDQIADESFIY
ncbi:hypothetical protein SteCoe_20731 [Stentor coeruleus]|uniref:RING-type domain-containing protein n=1 Tax=Stentor coeruleus TaxID=5963 RepID=A0A1R2BRN5_9CILI|nr:hypothetical protein SteCoe_20731 [Stentor coeruleus]